MKQLFETAEAAAELIKAGQNINKELTETLKERITKGFAGIVQTNPIVGNIEYNAVRINKYIKLANDIRLEVLVFPEVALTGCPLEDIVKRHPIVVRENIKWLRGIAKKTKETIVIAGFLEPSDDKNKYYNSLAVMQHGKIQHIVRNNIVSPYVPFNDNKYLKPSDENKSNNFFGEYCIFAGDEVFEKEDYILNQIKKSDKNPKVIILCSAAISNKAGENIKKQVLSRIAKKCNIPVIYVNQSGVNDSLSFIGGSCGFNSDGKLIVQAKPYEEQLLLVNPYDSCGQIYPDLMNTESKTEFSLDYEDDLERTYKALIQGTKDYFNKCGLKRAVLGLSGGLDSTVTAVILTDALGKENVFGVSMPSNITSSESKTDGKMLAENLGIGYTEVPIGVMFETEKSCFKDMFKNVEQKWTDRYQNSYTNDNLQARTRAMILWGISNEFPSCIPIATSDKSEAYMGYATINGDMSGGFAPIADITKTKLFALGRWLNKNREQKNVIPESVLLKRPGAELAINPKTGKALIAEDALMPYEFLDEIIWRIENKQEGYDELLSAKFVYESKNDISKEQKTEWIDKFYRRMSSALYKWTIMPPSIIIEEHSINGYNYRQLITSGKINYKGVNEEYISECLI